MVNQHQIVKPPFGGRSFHLGCVVLFFVVIVYGFGSHGIHHHETLKHHL